MKYLAAIYFSLFVFSLPAQAQLAKEGQPCGGVSEIKCDENLFCQFPENDCGASGKAEGVCVAVAEMCAEIFQPVCGCDGRTYPSACHAAAQKISVKSNGVCQAIK
jgi:hypothetical protein